MSTDPIPDNDLERAREAFRQAAAWRHRLPAGVLEAQRRVHLYLRRMERSGFDQDSFDALLESWNVIRLWMDALDREA